MVSDAPRCAVCTRPSAPGSLKCPFCGAAAGTRPEATGRAVGLDPTRLAEAMIAEAEASRGPSRTAVWLAATGCASALLAFFLWPGPEGSFRMTGIAAGLAALLLVAAYLRR